MYGRNALYSGKPRPMNAQTRMIKVVAHARLGVSKRARIWSNRTASRRCRTMFAAVKCCISPWSKASSSVIVKSDVFPFLLATSWTTFTACSFLPFPMRYLGDSKIVKNTNRPTNIIIAMPPIVIINHRHPMLSDFVHPSAESQVLYPSSGQPIKLATTCATAQSIDKIVNRY